MNNDNYTAATLAPALSTSVDSIRKVLARIHPDRPFDRHEVLNGSTVPVLEHFAGSPRAKEATKQAAQAILEGQGVTEAPPQPETPKPDPKPVPAPKPASGGKVPRWKRYARKDKATKATAPGQRVQIPVWIIALVLAPALIWQMEHYAQIVDRYSRIDHELVSYVFSWFFSFSVTGTAIVMTAAKGRLSYLYIFAGIETAANILYYLPGNAIEWGTAILISGAMAFTIFSYSEIFANTFKK